MNQTSHTGAVNATTPHPLTAGLHPVMAFALAPLFTRPAAFDSIRAKLAEEYDAGLDGGPDDTDSEGGDL